MANEAVLVFETHTPIPFIVTDGNALTKGAVLKFADPMTAAITAGAADICAGIASSDKIASDGTTTLGVFRGGIFRVYISGSVTAGDGLVTVASYPNFFKTTSGLSLATVLSGSRVFGIALETGTNGETILMELRPQVIAGTP